MYTDPGVLALIISSIVGGILAIPTLLFLFKDKVKEWFKGRKKE
jgi:hypothetical protein